jgi:LysM repeat protein
MPGIAPNCDRFYMIKSGDQCDSIAASAGISVAQLKSWNTEINASCSNLWLDYYICTHVPGAVLPTTTSTAPTPSNSPPMPGVDPKCSRFHKIKSGDQCDSIAASAGISVAQLKSWNTAIDATCSNLWLDYYVCTLVPGAVLPTTTSTAPTPSNSPTMPGAASNCNKWHKIASGNTCETIAAKNTITVAQFRKWNTQINTSMSIP